MKEYLPLLLTASVNPRGMTSACFSPQERELQYIETLNFYIHELCNKKGKFFLVFVENSGWNPECILNRLSSAANVSIEYISLDPQKFDISKGKGYNEMLMIDLATEVSSVLHNSKTFFKVTGRYPFRNIFALLREVTTRVGMDLQFYADVKDHKLFDWLHLPINGHWGECRYYAVSIDFWNKNMRGVYQYLDDNGYSVESFFLDLVRKSKGLPGVLIHFRTQPIICGYGAFKTNGIFFINNNYGSFINRIKDFIRQLFRWIMPWLLV